MRHILYATLLTTALSAPALSNAGITAQCPECPEAPEPEWKGASVGVQLGYGHEVKYYKPSVNKGYKGAFGGVHAAYDFQFGHHYILGAEASFDFIDPSLGTDKWGAAVVPRIGYGLLNSLFFVGCGWTGVKPKSKDFQNGVRLAVGIEEKFGRIILGLEADYDWFRKKTNILGAQVKLSYELG